MSQYLSQIHEGQVTVTKGAQRSLHIEIAHCDHDTLFGGVVAMTLLPVLTARGPVRNVCVGRSTGLLGELALLCRMTKGEARQVNAGRKDAPASQHGYISKSRAKSWDVCTLTRERKSRATLTETRRVRKTQLKCLPQLHDREKYVSKAVSDPIGGLAMSTMMHSITWPRGL